MAKRKHEVQKFDGDTVYEVQTKFDEWLKRMQSNYVEIEYTKNIYPTAQEIEGKIWYEMVVEYQAR